MNPKRVVIVCIIVSVLGLLSAAAGFAAEATKIKPSQIVTTPDGQCVIPKSPAVPLGIASVCALFIAHVVIFYETGYDLRARFSFLTLATSWIIFLTAFIKLLTAASTNNHGHSLHNGVSTSACNECNCHLGEPLVFTLIALYSLSSICYLMSYYLQLIAERG